MKKVTTGSWEEVLKVAGISVEDYNNLVENEGYPTKGSIIYAIRKRYLHLQGLRYKDLTKVSLGTLYKRGEECFGSWEQALEEAGIPQSEVETLMSYHKRYSKSQLIRYLQKRNEDEKGFRYIDLKNDGEYRVINYILGEFGTVENALQQAGVLDDWKDRLKMQQYIDRKHKTIAMVQERYKNGKGVRMVDMKKDGLEYRVYNLTEFCTWEDILLEAGIDEMEVKNLLSGFKYGTKQSVIKEIQWRMQEGKGLRYTDLIEEKDGSLYKQGKKFFGYWHKALEIAGVPVWYEKKRSKHLKSRK